MTAPDGGHAVQPCGHCGALTSPSGGGPDQPDTGTPPSAVVEMQLYGRSVRVEAPGPLESVAGTALNLWTHLGDRVEAPAGASGFVMVEQPGPPPLEMEMPMVCHELTEEPETSHVV